MAKKDYSKLADSIVDLMGGKDNITYFVNCTTRLRFNVKDKSVVDSQQIEKTENVIGIQWVGEQLQIIIGSDVSVAYNAICEKNNFTRENALDENLDAPKKKGKFSVAVLIDVISGCVAPLIPLFIAAGVLKTIVYLFQSLGVIGLESTEYAVLMGIADAGFYFLPIYVGATAAKRFETNVGLGMFVGGMLLYPSLVALMSGETAVKVFGVTIPSVPYAASLIPVILSVFILAHIERFFRRVIPEVISGLFVPMLTILVMVPIIFFVTGPLGMYVGSLFSSTLLWLYNHLGFLAVAFVCAVYPFMVITGMHLATTPYLIQALASLGFEPLIFVADFMHNFSEGAACTAVGLKTKNKNQKTVSFSCAVNAVVAGISEPAIYGVTLKNKTPMIAVVIGNAIGGIVAGILRVKIYGFAGTLGIFGLPLFANPQTHDFLFMVIAIIVAMIATFIITLIIYKENTNKAAAQ